MSRHWSAIRPRITGMHFNTKPRREGIKDGGHFTCVQCSPLVSIPGNGRQETAFPRTDPGSRLPRVLLLCQVREDSAGALKMTALSTSLLPIENGGGKTGAGTYRLDDVDPLRFSTFDDDDSPPTQKRNTILLSHNNICCDFCG